MKESTGNDSPGAASGPPRSQAPSPAPHDSTALPLLRRAHRLQRDAISALREAYINEHDAWAKRVIIETADAASDILKSIEAIGAIISARPPL